MQLKHENILAVIPARGGSKRIPNKNIRDFCGKPLIAYAIEQGKAHPRVDRVIVDTDDEEIARVAKQYGAEVPFLRPKELATDTAQATDALIHLLGRLKKEEGYEPTHVLLLQTTSPLREMRDIDACFEMADKTDAATVLTVAPTHPRLYFLDAEHRLILANKEVTDSTNVQAWPKAYLLNGCMAYIIKVSELLRTRKIFGDDVRGVICEKWRSVDLDEPEDWVAAELLYRHRQEIEPGLERINRQTVSVASLKHKDFDGWNEVKKKTDSEEQRLYTVRELWWCRFGVNVGTEQDGRGDWYVRPCVILRGFGSDACLVAPLTTSTREHPLRVSVGTVDGKAARANLSQLRVVDTRRLERKIGFLERKVFTDIRKIVSKLC